MHPGRGLISPPLIAYYETTYVWDETKQKKIQKRRCIGKVDPETNQIVKNGGRGRPRATPEQLAAKQNAPDPRIEPLLERISSIEKKLTNLNEEIRLLAKNLKLLTGKHL